MKTLIILLIGLLISATSCSNSSDEIIPTENQLMLSSINSLPSEPLSDAEKATLLFMREEEKLAHDVYVFLYSKWSNKVFDNISASEQTHMEAVLTLINKYELEDPAINEIGKFTNKTLQQLYHDLIESGSISRINAFKVGAAIEEIDIVDLQRELDTNIDNEDIIYVFGNLLSGSENHLRAFVKNLTNQNVTYSPQYLDKENYDEIINAASGNGRQ
jgi:hypothetical protein